MSSSGLIYATIAVVWAAVLVPTWLRRHDEVVESRSVDRFQGAMRTLSRRSSPGEPREVLVPRRGQTRAFPDGAAEPMSAAAQAAARRRRVTITLFATAVMLAALVALHKLPSWAPAVPALILAAFLLRARASARRARGRELTERRARAAEARRVRHEQVARTMAVTVPATFGASDVAGARQARRTPAFVDPAVVGRSTEIRRTPATPAPLEVPAMAAPRAPAFADPAVVGRTAEIRRGPSVPQARAVMDSANTGSRDPEFYDAQAAAAWEPVPVPVPTYVSAPKAPRSVRIVDLTKSGAWTSGRLPDAPLGDDDAVEGEPSAPVAGIVTGEVLVERRRAVGD